MVLPCRDDSRSNELISVGNESEAAGDRIKFDLHNLGLDDDLSGRRKTLAVGGSEPDGKVRSQRGVKIFRLGRGPQIEIVAWRSRIEEGVVVVVVVLAHFPCQSSIRKITILRIKGRTNKFEDISNGESIPVLGTDDLGLGRSIVGVDADSSLGAATLAILDNQLGIKSSRLSENKRGLGLGRIDSTIGVKVPLVCDLIAIGIVTSSTIKLHGKRSKAYGIVGLNQGLGIAIVGSSVGDAEKAGITLGSSVTTGHIIQSLSPLVRAELQRHNLLGRRESLHGRAESRNRRVTFRISTFFSTGADSDDTTISIFLSV